MGCELEQHLDRAGDAVIAGICPRKLAGPFTVGVVAKDGSDARRDLRGGRVSLRSDTPAPDQATRALTSILSSVLPAVTSGTPFASASCTPPKPPLVTMTSVCGSSAVKGMNRTRRRFDGPVLHGEHVVGVRPAGRGNDERVGARQGRDGGEEQPLRVPGDRALRDEHDRPPL